MIFESYASYYDDIYQGKDYVKESDFLLEVIKRYSQNPVKTILSLGCGTGTYEIILAKKGFEILGVDMSQPMLDIAQKKVDQEQLPITLQQADVTAFTADKEYDFAMAMFNIAGYLTKDQQMEQMLSRVNQFLKTGGLFVFDCWNKPAVLKDPPTDREKKISDTVTRKTTQTVDAEKSVINITFEMVDNGVVVSKETHPMRFWDLSEIKTLLEKTGFELAESCIFPEIDRPVSEDNWNMFIVAKKV